MFHLVRPAEQRRSANGTIAFEGRPYGGGVSVFLVNAAPGQGPELHTHPYSETWIVRSGRAEMRVGKEKLVAEPGDIIVVEPQVPHGSKCIGADRLEITCIHASDHFIQDWVEERGERVEERAA